MEMKDKGNMYDLFCLKVASYIEPQFVVCRTVAIYIQLLAFKSDLSYPHVRTPLNLTAPPPSWSGVQPA